MVGFFEGTLEKIVLLAVFLPVLAGQSGNTGCQALAVTLRGMTLGELKPGGTPAAVAKEAILGFFNGSLVGVSAGSVNAALHAWNPGVQGVARMETMWRGITRRDLMRIRIGRMAFAVAGRHPSFLDNLDGQRVTIELQGRRDDLAPGMALAIRLPPGALLSLPDSVS